MAPKAKSGSAKKPAGGGSSTKAAAPGGGGSEEQRWLQAQTAALAGQREAAAREGNRWIEEPHTWHEQRLEQLAQLLEAGSVTSLPSELREGVEFYVSQLAGGDVDQDSFYDDRDVYGDIFDRGESAPAPEGPPYERPAEMPEAEAAVAQVREWDNVTMQGIAKLERLLKEFAASPGVQEAGITRISALVAGSKDSAPSPSTAGLTPKSTVALVKDAMQRCPRDPDVQRMGCSAVQMFCSGDGALEPVLNAGGATLVVEALAGNLANAAIALSATRTLAFMTSRATKCSPEWAKLCSSGAEKVLLQVLPYHLNDPRIDKAARQAIPFLRA